MKEIIAFIRMSKIENVKKALEAAGFIAMTGKRVMGKGKKSMDIVDSEGNVIMQSHMMPKRMIIIETEDENVDTIVTIITLVSRTGAQGDGRIFVVPVLNSYRISTGEKV